MADQRLHSLLASNKLTLSLINCYLRNLS